eukprot:scaffold103340_cov27-Attheya_sp.AAC.2
MGWNNLLANVGKLSEEMSLQNENERLYREAISTSLLKIQASINLSDVKIQLLITRIGDVPKGDDGSVSLREAISALQESNQDVTKDINKGRVCLGAQGSRISTAENNMKHEDALYKLPGTLQILQEAY